MWTNSQKTVTYSNRNIKLNNLITIKETKLVVKNISLKENCRVGWLHWLHIGKKQTIPIFHKPFQRTDKKVSSRQEGLFYETTITLITRSGKGEKRK